MEVIDIEKIRKSPICVDFFLEFGIKKTLVTGRLTRETGGIESGVIKLPIYQGSTNVILRDLPCNSALFGLVM